MTWLTYIAMLQLTLSVSNYAHVDPKTLASAETEVTRIYENAGVSIEWVDDRTADFDINIRPLAGALGRTSITFGLAPDIGGDSHLAYVFYDRIERLFAQQISTAMERNISRWAKPEQILASVIAHEVGHLLGLSHSPSGIMRADWRAAELLAASYGRLLFTPQEGEVIRTKMKISERAE